MKSTHFLPYLFSCLFVLLVACQPPTEAELLLGAWRLHQVDEVIDTITASRDGTTEILTFLDDGTYTAAFDIEEVGRFQTIGSYSLDFPELTLMADTTEELVLFGDSAAQFNSDDDPLEYTILQLDEESLIFESRTLLTGGFYSIETYTLHRN